MLGKRERERERERVCVSKSVCLGDVKAKWVKEWEKDARVEGQHFFFYLFNSFHFQFVQFGHLVEFSIFWPEKTEVGGRVLEWDVRRYCNQFLYWVLLVKQKLSLTSNKTSFLVLALDYLDTTRIIIIFIRKYSL